MNIILFSLFMIPAIMAIIGFIIFCITSFNIAIQLYIVPLIMCFTIMLVMSIDDFKRHIVANEKDKILKDIIGILRISLIPVVNVLALFAIPSIIIKEEEEESL